MRNKTNKETLLQRCELVKSKGFTYNPETGIILSMNGNPVIKKNFGYLIIQVTHKRKQYYLRAHHFAWFMYYGNVSFDMLDHINQNKDDNRIENLRICTPQENNQNKLKITKGYTWGSTNKKWQAKIGVDGKTIYLGHFDTPEEARNEYLKAKKQYHKNYFTDID